MNNDSQLHPHLRIISNQKTSVVENTTRREPSQLEFSFSEGAAVFFVYINALNRSEFLDFFGNVSPRWIIDTRIVPRMDAIASSRQSAFYIFKSRNSSYIDFFGRIGIKSYRSADANPALWGPVAISFLDEAKAKGPFMFLFDNTELLDAAIKTLPNLFKHIIGRKGRFCKIDSYKTR